MEAQLAKARSQSKPVAILWASEGSIYGRYGFGPAARRLRLTLERPKTELRDATVSGPLRMVQRQEALQLFPKIYQRVSDSRPGLITRDPVAWEVLTADDNPHLPAEEAHHYFVVHGAEPDGYVIYRVRPGKSSLGVEATAVVTELLADTPRSVNDLWRYCLSLDLIPRVEARLRRIDEPLLWMASDPQAIEVMWATSIWARVLDVTVALQSRRYQRDGQMVLEVLDPVFPRLGGTFRLRVRNGGATCEPTTDRPDLRLGIAELSCGYLGQLCFGAMARAGLLHQARAGRAREMDQLFSWDPPPWCLDDF